ncbi:MAG TPA: NADH-quinone oxidoreductase subunit J [Aggregatilinea sp.]|uniref:NADH-quinone oxidoreductase subunit J n=1 Tax=Aggregatilinea sp. TaxID=2806333 RepID=UPI002BFFFD90|nr:NADH-quinone oxidoreductase subunit J [Aggregatilinea sp.]HML20008.1 NADH-quinone oxidoreductase subunit J [Aggregatilinea sp.]
MELTLFIIVGAIAVVAAAMMLISENAVHSALFLILNFACIAFFFLMLNAPFLAMVQITVYAGAIMVLFLFVIMLLGAERVFPGAQTRFRWMTPVAITLAVAFLLVASLAIVRGDVKLTSRDQTVPRVRVVNAASALDSIDVYVNDEVVASALAFKSASDFEAMDAGSVTVSMFNAGDDPQDTEPVITQDVDLRAGEAVSLTAIGTSTQQLELVPAVEDLSQPAGSDLRVLAINALPDGMPVDVRDVSQDELLFQDLSYGEAIPGVTIHAGTHSIGVFPTGDTNTHLAMLRDETLDAGKSMLWIFTATQESGNAWENQVIELEGETLASFGSPTHIGQLLFGHYILPFEMVALVLLVAMIGALVLTHDSTVRRDTQHRPGYVPAIDPITREVGK